MNNHYHLMIETPDGNLAQIMRHINGAYTTYFNTRHDRVGHLFQGRYRSILVDADAYSLALSRYIHLNPVKEGLSSTPWEYEWSSCRFFLDVRSSPEWLQTGFLLSLFGHNEIAVGLFREYLKDGESLYGRLDCWKTGSKAMLGRQEFVDEIRDEYLSKVTMSRDVPAARALKSRPEISRVIETVSAEISSDHRLAKKMSIYLCHHFCGCSLREIGDYFGVGESAVTETSNRFAEILYADQRLAETVAGLLSVLKM
jgi:hypothetical protein